jgi:hypothetical protein
MKWAIWAVVLILQQFSHGLSSRAKNSNSYTYNIVAATFSNGVWICSNFFLVENVLSAIKDGDLYFALRVGVFYTFFCVLGSFLSQYVAINFIEQKMRYANRKQV